MDERFTDSGRSRPSDKVGPGLPDSEIKGGGGEGAGSVSFGLKIRGGRAPLLDPALIENVQSTK